ncbi:MAG: nucleic acid-binding protein, partial [Treponema sp.]|nr:nucleic acid-binding protein [Treponema sp.]
MQMAETSIKEELERLQEILNSKYELERKVEVLPRELDSQKENLDLLKKEYTEKFKEYEVQKEKVSTLREDLESADKERERMKRTWT